MDMQPLQAPTEASERLRNQSIVSKGTQQKAKALSSREDDQYPHLLMMSSLSGEADSAVGEFSSPSKRLLDEKNRKHTKASSRGRRQNKTKTSSSRGGSGGMSSKITRALFRDRRMSHGSFNKMDSMASDERGSHFKRSARSPFYVVEPRKVDFGSLTAVPLNEGPVLSFDNASTNSGLASSESPSPSPSVPIRRKDQTTVRTTSPRFQQNGPPTIHEEQSTLTSGNVSAFSAANELSSRKSPTPPAQSDRTMTMAAGNIPASTKAPSSVASSVSSLNYSESHASSLYEPNNLYGASSLAGVKLAPTKSEDTSCPPPSDVEEPITNVNASFNDLLQDRFKERIEDVESPTNNSICTAASKKIPPIKPPPPLPPKAPRRRIESPTNNSFHSAPSSSLKEHEERLIKGGEFLNESSDSAPDGGSDLPLKLLLRLEAAQNDANLMANHHDQDPPLEMGTVPSFGSSTITSRRATTARLRSYSSKDSSSNAYAGLNSDGIRAENTSRSSTSEVPLVDEDEEEEDVILSSASHVAIHPQAVESNHDSETKLCYLYSQDKEFENSILSPQYTGHLGTPSATLPSSSPTKTLYRSDAIDTFMKESGCSSNDKFLGAVKEMGYETACARPTDTPISDLDTEDQVVDDEENRNLVSEEFLNMVTSGCTGVPNPAAKEAMKEKLVALEAGWGEFRTQFNERFQTLEESWQSWNLNSLMQFTSPAQTEAAAAAATKEESKPPENPVRNTAPIEMGTTTILTTPPSKSRQSPSPKVDEPLPQVELELVQADDSVLIKSPASEEEVVLGVVRELARSKAAATAAAAFKAEDIEEVEKILMGSTEHDVPLSLRNTLADISIIADGNNQSGCVNSGGRSASPGRPKPFLDCSREDSEGGKVILDAAEWDPVYSSDTGEDETETEPITDVPEVPVPSQPQAHKSRGFVLFRAKNWGKRKTQAASPKSVLAEI